MSILSKSDRQYLNSIVSNFNKELGDFFGSNIAMSDLSPQKISEFLVKSERRAETVETIDSVRSLIQSYLNNIKLILDKVNSYQDEVDTSLSSNREETTKSILALQDQLREIEGFYSQINHNHNTLYSTLEHDHDGSYALVKHTHQDLQKVIEKVQLELQRLQSKSKNSPTALLPHAREHVTGKDQIPLATSKTRGLASPVHIRNIEKALLLAEQAALTAKPLFGGGAGSGGASVSVETDPIFSVSEAASFAAGDKSKLDGIQDGAEVNNISDVNATDLTDSGATTLHTHDHGNLDGLTDDDHTRYFDKDGSKAATGNFDLNYKQLLRSAIQNDVIANIPVTGSEVEGQQFLATDICTLFLYCDGAWRAMQSFDAVNIYVDGTSGTDAAGKGYGSGTDAVATIQYAIDLIPPVNGGNVVVSVAAGTYSEEVSLKGKNYSGDYSIQIIGDTTTLDSGTATSATALSLGGAGAGIVQGTLSDTSKGWTINDYQNKLLVITGGTGYSSTNPERNEYVIDSNTATVLTIVGYWTTATPDATTTYEIREISTIIDGGNARNYCILVNGNNSITLTNIDFKNAKSRCVYYINSAMDGYVNSCSFSSSNALVVLLEVASGANCFMRSNFLDQTGNRGGVRYLAGSAVGGALTETFMNNKFSGSTGVTCLTVAGLAFAGQLKGNKISGGNYCLDVNSFSRCGLTQNIFTDAVTACVYIREHAYVIFAPINEISNCSGDGVKIDGQSLLLAALSSTQSNNNGGWGLNTTNISYGKGVSGFSYTGNASGTYTADATSVNT